MAFDRQARDDALSGDVQRFSSFLQKSTLPYLLVQQLEDFAELRFVGPFESRDVVWHCEFTTLAAELKCLAQEDPAAPASMRNFIEVGDPESHGVPVRVGLAVPRIDAPAIEKMILMMRLYRNLRRGRHEYGDAVQRLPVA